MPFKLVVLGIILFFLFISSNYPIIADPSRGHDDALFFRGLESIIRGDWLGQYDNLTLAKGPLLSIIGALSSIIGIQEKMLEAFLYSAMILLFAWSARRIGVSRSLVLVAVFCLVANPSLWSGPGRRYLRETIYAVLAVGLFVMTLLTMMEEQKKEGFFFAFAAGVLSGSLFLTREEDVWWLAFSSVLVLLALLRNIFTFGLVTVLSKWKTLAIRLAFVVLGSGLSIGPVLAINYFHYGIPIVSEFRSPEFKQAVGALMRVGDIHPSGYVPVSRSAMAEVLASVEESFSLRDHWLSVATKWGAEGESLLPDYQGEIAGGWFVWALRDAVAAAGHYRSAQSARNFYSALGAGVNAACDGRKLLCRARRDTLAPELTKQRIPQLIAASWRALLFTVTLSTPPITAPRSYGESSKLDRWNQIIGPVIESERSPATSYSLSGWLAHPKVAPAIGLVRGSQARINRLDCYPAPDVLSHFDMLGMQGVGATRFNLKVDCLGAECAITAFGSNGDQSIIKITNPMPGALLLAPPFWGYLDVVTTIARQSSIFSALENFKVNIVSSSVNSARLIVLFLCALSTVGVLIYPFISRNQKRCDWIFIAAVGAAAAVIGRCLIIGYIEISSWHAIKDGYLGPAYPFVIGYSVLGTTIFLNFISKSLKNFKFCISNVRYF